MKFVYIDDSYLRPSAFLDTMRNRLFHFCEQEQVTHIFLSGSVPKNMEPSAQSFLKECEKREIYVVIGPCTFEIGELQGVLRNDALLLEDFPKMMSFSGSALLGNSETHELKRVYFELFPHYEIKENMELLEDELMDVIQEILTHHKKVKQTYH